MNDVYSLALKNITLQTFLLHTCRLAYAHRALLVYLSARFESQHIRMTRYVIHTYGHIPFSGRVVSHFHPFAGLAPRSVLMITWPQMSSGTQRHCDDYFVKAVGFHFQMLSKVHEVLPNTIRSSRIYMSISYLVSLRIKPGFAHARKSV